MGNVNSRGLTWIEWRDAAGYSENDFGGHDGMLVWGELRNDWKAGVDPALHAQVKADSGAERDPECVLGFRRKGV